MDLKGQMIFMSEMSALLFLGSPCVDKLEELTGRGLYLSDIPIHNALRDVVLVGEQTKAQDGLKKRLGKAKAALEQAHQALEEEKRRTVELLFTIFPGNIAQRLWQGLPVPAKKFDHVTMLFSRYVGSLRSAHDVHPCRWWTCSVSSTLGLITTAVSWMCIRWVKLLYSC